MTRFCVRCGGATALAIPPGDNRERHVCGACGAIDYQNPRLVVGAVVEHGDSVILCRRAIEPRLGFWTIPAGFLELGEPASEGAARETFEETGVRARIEAPLVHFDLPAIGQIYLLFRAFPVDLSQLGQAETLSESLEVRAFGWENLPWNALAFDAVRLTLALRKQDRQEGIDRMHYGALRRLPEVSTIGPHSHSLEGHLALRVGR
jgi:ADP-ribose pyrophosphatase YjhB (NUDIX family)